MNNSSLPSMLADMLYKQSPSPTKNPSGEQNLENFIKKEFTLDNNKTPKNGNSPQENRPVINNCHQLNHYNRRKSSDTNNNNNNNGDLTPNSQPNFAPPPSFLDSLNNEFPKLPPLENEKENIGIDVNPSKNYETYNPETNQKSANARMLNHYARNHGKPKLQLAGVPPSLPQLSNDNNNSTLHNNNTEPPTASINNVVINKNRSSPAHVLNYNAQSAQALQTQINQTNYADAQANMIHTKPELDIFQKLRLMKYKIKDHFFEDRDIQRIRCKYCHEAGYACSWSNLTSSSDMKSHLRKHHMEEILRFYDTAMKNPRVVIQVPVSKKQMMILDNEDRNKNSNNNGRLRIESNDPSPTNTNGMVSPSSKPQERMPKLTINNKFDDPISPAKISNNNNGPNSNQLMTNLLNQLINNKKNSGSSKTNSRNNSHDKSPTPVNKNNHNNNTNSPKSSPDPLDLLKALGNHMMSHQHLNGASPSTNNNNNNSKKINQNNNQNFPNSTGNSPTSANNSSPFPSNPFENSSNSINNVLQFLSQTLYKAKAQANQSQTLQDQLNAANKKAEDLQKQLTESRSNCDYLRECWREERDNRLKLQEKNEILVNSQASGGSRFENGDVTNTFNKDTIKNGSLEKICTTKNCKYGRRLDRFMKEYVEKHNGLLQILLNDTNSSEDSDHEVAENTTKNSNVYINNNNNNNKEENLLSLEKKQGVSETLIKLQQALANSSPNTKRMAVSSLMMANQNENDRCTPKLTKIDNDDIQIKIITNSDLAINKQTIDQKIKNQNNNQNMEMKVSEGEQEKENLINGQEKSPEKSTNKRKTTNEPETVEEELSRNEGSICSVASNNSRSSRRSERSRIKSNRNDKQEPPNKRTRSSRNK